MDKDIEHKVRRQIMNWESFTRIYGLSQKDLKRIFFSRGETKNENKKCE